MDIKKLNDKNLSSMFFKVCGYVPREGVHDRQMMIAIIDGKLNGGDEAADMWFTQEFRDAYSKLVDGKDKTQKRGELPDETVLLVKQLRAEKMTYKEIHEITGVGENACWYITHGVTYKDVK